MSESDSGNNKRVILITVAVVAILVAVVVAYNTLTATPPGPTAGQATFYDVSSGETFIASAALIPPIAAPSRATDEHGDPAGAKAHVFACGSCDDVDARFVGWIEKYTAAAKAAQESIVRDTQSLSIDDVPPAALRDIHAAVDTGRLIARASTPVNWVEADSAEARTIYAEVDQQCGNQPVMECRP